MRAAAKKGFIAACSVLLTLLLLEVGVRLFSACCYPRMMQPDAQLGWKHSANVHRVFVNELGERAEVRQNQYGDRGPTYPLAKDANRYRILVLGDSFVEGVQVGEDDLFTALLERTDPQLEVLNAGVAGYGTVQEYLYLETAGLKHNPDLVLLMIFDNDLSDNCSPAYPAFGPRPYAIRTSQTVEIVRKPESEPFRKYLLPVPGAGALNRHSYLFYVLNSYVYQRLRATHMQELENADLKLAQRCDRYAIMFAMIEKVRQLLSSHGVRLAVVLIPTDDDVQHGKAPELQPILDYCAREDIPCLSLLDRFTQGGTAPLTFPNDIHWTKAGHQRAAEAISQFVRGVVLAQH